MIYFFCFINQTKPMKHKSKIVNLFDKLKFYRGDDKKFSFWRWFKWVSITFIFVSVSVSVLAILLVVSDLPDINNIQNLVAAQSSSIYDRNGELLYTIHGEENRKNISFEEIPKHTINAVLSMEDDQFYNHGGVDFGAIAKAVCSEAHICSQARGGSTITQQFIKNAFLSSERTYKRKAKEIILAMQLEGRFTKNEILEMYFNRIPYGSSIYGVEKASNTFFDKTTSELTLAESAILASIPKAPTFYSPYGDHKYPTINIDEEAVLKLGAKSEEDLVSKNPNFVSKGLIGKTYSFGTCPDKSLSDSEPVSDNNSCVKIYVKGRVDYVLQRMLDLKYITKEDYDSALVMSHTLEFKPFKDKIKAPHFVMYVKQIIEDKYGKEQVEKGGLKITTTLDLNMQESAEKILSEKAESNLERYNASNASLLAMDPNTGQILTMVGSVDYFNDEIDGKVNVALRPRLPGSSFKPIAYATAFLYGYAPSTVLYDVKTKFGGWYEPNNYDGQFRGPVTMRNALASSLNIPAVKAGFLAGIPNILDLARKMGIQLNQSNDWYGLSLALGAGEARLIDMVSAYSVFANGGNKVKPVSILKIEDRHGNILEEYQEPEKELILDPQVAYLINDVLSDVQARPAGWWRDRLSIPNQINAAKTGTSNKEKNNVAIPFDTWTIGYTRRLAVGVWAGNNNGDTLNYRASGLDTAGGMWHDFMVEATKNMPRENFERPDGIKWVSISKKTGKLPSKHTPKEDITTGVFASFSVPREYENSYHMLKIDKVSGKLATEYTPEAAIEEKAFFEHHSILIDNENWETAVRLWAKENNEDEEIPTEYDDVHTAKNSKQKPTVHITTPSSMSSVSPPYVGVWLNIKSLNSIKKVEYYWDDKLVFTADKPPYNKGKLRISKMSKNGSKHIIKAIVFDDLYNTSQSSIKVKIEKDVIPPQVNFVYPDNDDRIDASVMISAQVSAKDVNGDISKVEFYLDGKLKETIKTEPFIWQFVSPEDIGSHNLKAIAYDYSKNKSSSSIDVFVKKGNQFLGGDFRILEPSKGSSFRASSSIVIKAYLDAQTRKNLKSFEVLARRKRTAHNSNITKTVIATVSANEDGNNAYLYNFIWDNTPVGTYDLYLSVVDQNGKTHVSKKNMIIIQP